jgi:hypothetical protein
MGLGDGAAEPVRVLRNHAQMDVIRHQAISPYHGPACRTGLDHQPQVIRLAEERQLATVPSLRNVMRITGSNDARQSCHGRSAKRAGAAR